MTMNICDCRGSKKANAFEPAVSTLIRIYEKLAHFKYEKQCSITKLNSETLAPILRLLNTKDRKNVRLTCKAFKASLDHHVGIHVNLDQRKIDRKGDSGVYLPPGGSSLRLWGIKSPQHLDYLLKRSHLVTVVHFAGQISLSAFTKIVTRCKNLRSISFTDRCHMYANITPVMVNQLHTLDLGCPGFGTDYVGEDAVLSSLWLTYEILLKRMAIPSLKVFRIYFCCVEDCSVLHQALAQILRFLAAHTSVDEFSLNLHHRYERFNFLANDTNFRRFRVDVPKRILRRIKLQKIQIETMEAAFKVWDSILPGQKSVTHLDIMNRSRRWFYFSKIISNNFATLKDIRLHNISPTTTKTPVLDARLFEECRSLETLFLSRFENSTQEVVYCYPSECTDNSFLDMETSSKAEMENLSKLPSSLRSLHIQGVVLETEDILAAMKKLRNLRTLELQLVGYHMPSVLGDIFQIQLMEPKGAYQEHRPWQGLGVTPQVIQTVFSSCRNLEVVFIEEFENPWTKLRESELGDKIHRISHIPGEGYFDGGAYYGLLICSEIPRNTGKLTRSERMHLWDVRLSQYYQHFQQSNRENKKSSVSDDASTTSGCSDSDQDESEIPLGSNPISSTSLLEILDKENGQLEQIQRLLDTRTPPPECPEKMRAEETRKLAQKYYNTLYSAIPNYHKATRLLEPTEKFISFFSRPTTTLISH